MKNLLYSIIKYGTVVGLGLGALAHTSFAAMVITPATAPEIGTTSATVTAKVSNMGWTNAAVWFEWGETPTLERPVVGLQDLYIDGYFEHRLAGLKENTTYYFRAVAMSNSGETVHSPTTTFTTGNITPAPVVKKQEPVEQAVVVPTIVKKTDTVEPVKKETSESTAVVKKAAPVKKTATSTTATSSAQSALLFGVGGGAFPQTLIGWLVLFIVVLVIVVLSHMIYDTNRKRMKALEKAKQEAKIMEEMKE